MLRGLTSLDVDVHRDAGGVRERRSTARSPSSPGRQRGIGRGTAIALGEQGATVYVTGRTTGDGELTIDTTVRLVDAAGGTGIAVQTDHGDDAQIAALFERVGAEQGKLDVLVNNVYKIPDPPAWGGGFWDHPVSIWDDQVGIGLRAHYVASWHAAPLLFAAGPGGAIINVSSPGGQSLPLQLVATARARPGSTGSVPTWPSSWSRRASPAARSTRAAWRPSSSRSGPRSAGRTSTRRRPRSASAAPSSPSSPPPT